MNKEDPILRQCRSKRSNTVVAVVGSHTTTTTTTTALVVPVVREQQRFAMAQGIRKGFTERSAPRPDIVERAYRQFGEDRQHRYTVQRFMQGKYSIICDPGTTHNEPG